MEPSKAILIEVIRKRGCHNIISCMSDNGDIMNCTYCDISYKNLGITGDKIVTEEEIFDILL